MKSDGMRKFFHELLLYFWIPLIVALVSYIFFELNDATLGLSVLVASTVVYAMARLYYMYKKWWLLVIMLVVVLGAVGIYFLKAPAATLTINEQEVTGTSITLPEGTVTIIPAPQGNKQYGKNTVVTLTAEPAAGYDWTGWTGTDSDATNPTTVTMDGDKKITVSFGERYSLIINNQQVIGSFVSLTEGSITVNPPPSNIDGRYSKGTKVTLTVVPNSGYDWKSWIGTDYDNANPTTITMNSGKQITLAFSGRFELTINGQTVTNNVMIFSEGSVAVDPPPGNDAKLVRHQRLYIKSFHCNHEQQ
ncbi:MAG: InlB B-repeat-containing protein [Dehalococcoidales bacterium]